MIYDFDLFLQYFRTYFTVCKTGYQFVADNQSVSLFDDLAVLQRQTVTPLQYIVGRSHLDKLFGQLDKTAPLCQTTLRTVCQTHLHRFQLRCPLA